MSLEQDWNAERTARQLAEEKLSKVSDLVERALDWDDAGEWRDALWEIKEVLA